MDLYIYMYSTYNSNYPQLKWISVTFYTVNGPISRLQAATCYPRSSGTLQRVTHVSLEDCSPRTLHSNLVIWLSLSFGNLLQSEHNNELSFTENIKASFRGVNQLEREVHHLFPLSAYIKNEWVYASSPPIHVSVTWTQTAVP